MASRGDIDFQKIQPELCKEWLTIPLEKSIDKTPKYIKHKTKGLSSSGSFPVVDQGDSLIAGYIEDKNKTYQGKLPIVIFGDHTRIIKYVDFPFAVGADGTKILKPNDNFNSKFFFHYLKALSVPDLGYSRHFKVLKEIKVPQPPRPEQDRIVAKVDTLMAQVEIMQKSLERIPQLLKDFRQQVLTQAVTGKLTEEWREGKEIKNWKNTTIGQLFDVRTGATPKRGNPNYHENGSIPWLKSGQVKNEFIYSAEEFITDMAIKETNTKIYPIDTLLVAMYGEGKTRGQVGWMKIEAASNQAIAALVNEEMDIKTKQYVYYYCLSQYNEIRSKAEGGNQPNLSLSKIKNWEIKIPLFEEQQEIVSRVESLFSKADAIEQQYKALKTKIDTLPQAILHKAFKGELVEQLESDGDARDLLREIGGLKSIAGKKSSVKTKKVVDYKLERETLGQVAEEKIKFEK